MREGHPDTVKKALGSDPREETLKGRLGKEVDASVASEGQSSSTPSIDEEDETASPQKRYQCHVCPRLFLSTASRDRHFKAHPRCMQTGKDHEFEKSSSDRETFCRLCRQKFPVIADSAFLPSGSESTNLPTSADTFINGNGKKIELKPKIRRKEREHSEFVLD